MYVDEVPFDSLLKLVLPVDIQNCRLYRLRFFHEFVNCLFPYALLRLACCLASSCSSHLWMSALYASMRFPTALIMPVLAKYRKLLAIRFVKYDLKILVWVSVVLAGGWFAYAHSLVSALGFTGVGARVTAFNGW